MTSEGMMDILEGVIFDVVFDGSNRRKRDAELYEDLNAHLEDVCFAPIEEPPTRTDWDNAIARMIWRGDLKEVTLSNVGQEARANRTKDPRYYMKAKQHSCTTLHIPSETL